mmetsp:Transcript_8911/g.16333  ORF Transcript_8911/g.16333 Transcript_8911/m.16333 type:complete len:103 (+) Transcript_8911:743-1051(+)
MQRSSSKTPQTSISPTIYTICINKQSIVIGDTQFVAMHSNQLCPFPQNAQSTSETRNASPARAFLKTQLPPTTHHQQIIPRLNHVGHWGMQFGMNARGTFTP